MREEPFREILEAMASALMASNALMRSLLADHNQLHHGGVDQPNCPITQFVVSNENAVMAVFKTLNQTAQPVTRH